MVENLEWMTIEIHGGNVIDFVSVYSQVFQDLTPKVLDIIKPDVLPGIQDYIASRVNETIHHLTMRDIFNVLIGQNEIRDFADLLVP